MDGPQHKLFDGLRRRVRWQQHQVKVFGRRWPAPRLSAWYGEPGAEYRYSGLRLTPLPWLDELARLRELVERITGARFNAVLLNRYRHGQDGMGWHSDDEPELGPTPTVAALSLGETRTLLLRRRDGQGSNIALELGDTSLLLMQAPLQQYWQHCLPKTRRPIGERISLTFRQSIPILK